MCMGGGAAYPHTAGIEKSGRHHAFFFLMDDHDGTSVQAKRCEV